MPESMTFLGLSGSLRAGSYNTMALKVAQSLAPDGVSLEILPLHDIPLYNEDVRAAGFPPSVQTLRDRIKAADALVIATPEYNYSISGVLKNAIDWASRPPEHPFENKPIGILGASPGKIGTARAQYHLRQMFVFLNGIVLNKPEVMISAAHTVFDGEGKLVDEATGKFIADFMVDLEGLARRVKAGAR